MKIIVEMDRVTLAFHRPFTLLEEDLSRALQAKGFGVPPSDRSVLRVSQDGRQSVAVRWVKDEIEAFYEPTRSLLSVEGKIPSKVASAFNEVASLSRELLGKEFQSELKWAELHAIIRSIGAKNPLDAFRKHTSKEIVDKLGKSVGKKTNPFLIAVYSASDQDLSGPLTEISDWVHVSVEPLIANPKYYLIRIVYRQSDLSSVEQFSSRLEDIAKEIIGGVEA